MHSSKSPTQPAAPTKAPQPPHSGEGSDSALEALKRATRTKPNARERMSEARPRRK